MTLACLAAMTLIVILCTLSEAKLGVFQAVDIFIRSFFIYATVADVRIPILPGGALVGALLVLNLVAAQFRLEVSARKAGLWVAHLGLILLFLGEFISGAVRHETRMSIERGQTLNYAEDARRVELALTDETDAASDRVHSISESFLRRRGVLGRPALPLVLSVHRFATRDEGDQLVDAQADVEIAEQNPLSPGGGRWTLSMREEGVRFTAKGRRYQLALRRRRRYLPVSLTLNEFRREIYPGSDIPRSFASRVTVSEIGKPQPPRPAVISMNNPLRLAGISFYQSGFAQDDRVSILEVVDNPAWVLPYLSCALVSLGLLIHFGRRLAMSSVLRS